MHPLRCQTLPAVAKTREYYSGRVIYADDKAYTLGQISVKAPASAAFNTNISTIALDTHAPDRHDANGERSLVTLTREKIPSLLF